MGNHESVNLEILPCLDNTTVDCYKSFSHANDALNYLSIAVNILHQLILSQMKELKATKYYWILTCISFSDIINSIMGVLHFSCEIKLAILNLSTVAANSIFKMIIAANMFSATTRYLVFLISSVEKYIAVCLPYQYETHTLIIHIRSFTGTLLAASFLMNLVTNIAKDEPICCTPLKVGYFPNRTTSIVYGIYGGLAVFIYAIIGTLLAKVWKELKMITKRNSYEEQLILAASKYISWTCLLHILSNIFFIVFLIFEQINLPAAATSAIEASVAVFNSLFGTGNVALFAYFHPKYVEKVKSCFKIGRSLNSVRPDSTTKTIEK